MNNTYDPFAVGKLLGWVWTLPVDPAASVAELLELGFTGIIPQESANAPGWIARHEAALAPLDIVTGLGLIDQGSLRAALRLPYHVMLDEECKTDVGKATALCAQVLTEFPDAGSRCTDCMYPCAVSTPPAHGQKKGSATGHGAISKAYSPLCAVLPRFPQDYDEVTLMPDGFVDARAEWARDPSQWPSLGVPASRILPSVQLYSRSAADHLTFFLKWLARGAICGWNLREMDKGGHGECRTALKALKALKALGLATADGFRSFQTEHGLEVDGILGPESCEALSVQVPNGIVWTHHG